MSISGMSNLNANFSQGNSAGALDSENRSGEQEAHAVGSQLKDAGQALCNIPLDISKEDLEQRMRVLASHDFGMILTINLHGFEFRATLHSADAGFII